MEVKAVDKEILELIRNLGDSGATAYYSYLAYKMIETFCILSFIGWMVNKIMRFMKEM